jgi:diacylglycerol kinase
MVCCTIIAGLLALLIKPLMAMRSNPLTWRLSGGSGSMKPEAPRAVSRLASFSHAFDGWYFLTSNEPNMRIHLAAAVTVAIAGILLEISATDWRWLIAAIAAILVAEALNTAVEQTCNAISREFNLAIKAAKDVAAGGVLIAAIAAVLIGASVFVPYLSGGNATTKPPLNQSICGGEI